MGPSPEAPPGEAITLNGLELSTSLGGDSVLRVTHRTRLFLGRSYVAPSIPHFVSFEVRTIDTL